MSPDHEPDITGGTAHDCDTSAAMCDRRSQTAEAIRPADDASYQTGWSALVVRLMKDVARGRGD